MLSLEANGVYGTATDKTRIELIKDQPPIRAFFEGFMGSVESNRKDMKKRFLLFCQTNTQMIH